MIFPREKEEPNISGPMSSGRLFALILLLALAAAITLCGCRAFDGILGGGTGESEEGRETAKVEDKTVFVDAKIYTDSTFVNASAARKRELSRLVTIAPIRDREVILEQLVDGKFVKRASYTKADAVGSDEAKDAKGTDSDDPLTIRVTFPGEGWRGETYTRWRLRIPETSTQERRKKNGSAYTLTKRYKGAAREVVITAYNIDKLELTSRNAVVLDERGQVLYAKAMNEERPPASTTKVMTGLLAFEKGNMGSIIMFTREGALVDYSKLGWPFKDKYVRLSEMTAAAMISSSNGAAESIAQALGGDDAGFAKMMNRRAKELGMEHTHYVNPHGLHDDKHYSTVLDQARLMRYAYTKYPGLRKMFATEKMDIHALDANGRAIELENKKDEDGNPAKQEVEIHTTNTMLGVVEGMRGGKTGWTDEAGSCLVCVYEAEGHLFYVATFGSYGEKSVAVAARDEDQQKLFGYIREHAIMP